MKLEILIGFRDKDTQKLYKKGEIVNFKKARAEELLLNHKKLVKEVKNDW